MWQDQDVMIELLRVLKQDHTQELVFRRRKFVRNAQQHNRYLLSLSAMHELSASHRAVPDEDETGDASDDYGDYDSDFGSS